MQLIMGRGRATPDIESPEPLWVNNCGAYIDWGKNKRTLRPSGRSDWQMIFITEGRGFFTIDGQSVEMTANTVVIYPPHVPQEYRFFSSDTPSFWWVHYSGRDAKRLTERICPGMHVCSFYMEDTSGAVAVLSRMRAELSHGDGACDTYLCGLLCELAGLCEKAQNTPHTRYDADMERVREYISDNYACHESVDTYARIAGLSKYHFIRRFCSYTGRTPLEYATFVRLQRAEEMLTSGELSVGECSQLLGYNDQFYFCRLFKKHYGLSPAAYKRACGARRHSSAYPDDPTPKPQKDCGDGKI